MVVAAQCRKLLILSGESEGDFRVEDHMGLEVGMGVFSERREEKSSQAGNSVLNHRNFRQPSDSGTLQNSGWPQCRVCRTQAGLGLEKELESGRVWRFLMGLNCKNSCIPCSGLVNFVVYVHSKKSLEVVKERRSIS